MSNAPTWNVECEMCKLNLKSVTFFCSSTPLHFILFYFISWYFCPLFQGECLCNAINLTSQKYMPKNWSFSAFVLWHEYWFKKLSQSLLFWLSTGKVNKLFCETMSKFQNSGPTVWEVNCHFAIAIKMNNKGWDHIFAATLLRTVGAIMAL